METKHSVYCLYHVKTNQMNRRELIVKAFVGGTVIALSPSIISACTKVTDPGTNNNGNKPLTVDLTDINFSGQL
jgi:hypothetical protein